MITRGTIKPGTWEMHTEMEAKLDPSRGIPTPVNLTNHCYWNLSGSLKENIGEHGLTLQCDRYLPLDENQVKMPSRDL